MKQLFSRIVVWAFERFYHEFAWTYDLVAWLISRGFWSRWIQVIVPDLAGQPLLELGCGTGYLQQARKTEQALTVGLDESRSMLRLSRRKHAPAKLVRARAQALPWADDSWIAIVSTFPAPYLFDPATLREIRRVLRADGALYIVDGGVVPAGTYQTIVTLIYRLVFGASSVAQQPESTPIDARIVRLEQYGFTVTSEWRAVGASQVQILTATPVEQD